MVLMEVKELVKMGSAKLEPEYSKCVRYIRVFGINSENI